MIKKFFYVFFLVLVSLVCLVACGEEPAPSKKVEIELLLSTEMNVGDEDDILVNVLYAEVSDIVWTVEDPAVLKIENGKVIALAGGTTKVSAKIGDVEASITVKVIQSAVKIEFELNGGTCEVELPTSRDGSTPIELPVPTKRGYEFKGWYVGETLYEKISATDKSGLRANSW